MPREVADFGLRGSVGARLAGTIAANVTQVMVSSRLDTAQDLTSLVVRRLRILPQFVFFCRVKLLILFRINRHCRTHNP